MRVLVTGGAGYIGSHVVWWLREHGHEPIVFDDLSTGHAEAVRAAPLIRGDLCRSEEVMAVFAQHRPQAVMHFAARSLVGESVSNPRRYFHDNLIGALHLFDAMQRHEMPFFIFSSTAATYGTPTETPIPEEHTQIPINPYGDTKLTIERMLAAYDKAYGLRYATLRYFNAAGAAPDQGLGERHEPETHLIPLVLQVPLGRRPAVQIFGRDYATPDGTCVRDYIHVLDLAEAHGIALERLAAGSESLALNLGTGAGHSVLEVVSAAREVTARTIPAQDAPRRPGDPPVLVAGVEKALRVLAWKPRYTLHDMIESAWRFYCSDRR
jgi:UDP-glucose-4-epimerase GalE